MKSFNLAIITTLSGLLITSNPHIATSQPILNSESSQELENPSPNLSPKRREALKIPPSLVGNGVRWLGQTIANNTTPAQIKQIAQAVTVKISSNNKRGSGVLIHKQGTTYTVITNAHVISNKAQHRIQTPDNKIHTATVINQGNSLTGNDLAVLQFQAQEDYQTLPLTNTELAENQAVFAVGFPDGSKELVISSGKISLLSTQPLVGGYQIGYTNEIKQGMSGGALINQSGQLVGINGLASNAILNEAYNYQNGTKPSAEEIQKLRQLSFAVPIQTLAKVAPNLAILPPEWRNQQQAQIPAGNTFVDKVDNIAQQITVRIDSQKNGNGSGVIIAKQGNTYYVATARHVVQNPDNYEIVAPDGKRYLVQSQDIFKPEGIDAALVKFTSNQTYSVAAIAKYKLYSSVKRSWIFVSGFPQQAAGQRKFTAGLLGTGRESVFSRAVSLNYLNVVLDDRGSELTYTNLTQPGMSGGAVLDAMGQVIGINTGIDRDPVRYNNNNNQIELGLGLGVPSDSILSLVTQWGLKPGLLKIAIKKPSNLTEAEINLLKNYPVFVAKKPSDNSNEYDWLNYGNQLWRLQRHPEAVAAFQQAIKLKPYFYKAYYALGVAMFSQKKYPEAIAANEEAIKINPIDEPWILKSSSLIGLKKYPEALAAIDKAIEYNDEYPSLYIQRGYILSSLKRYPEALASINKAIKLKPLFNYYQARGDIRFLLTDYEGALADYNQAIKIQPDSASNYLWRSNVRSSLKDYEGALADCNQAIKIQPDNGDGYSCRGNIRFKLKDYQRALVDLNQAIKLDPDDIYYWDRAKIHSILQDYKAALADYNQAIKIAQNLAISYINRGNFYTDVKDYQSALADYNQAIKLDKNLAIVYSFRGIVYREMKDYQRALADYNQAIKLDKNLAIAYISRGNFYREMKDYQRALADLDYAIKLDPNNSYAYFSRSNVYNDLQDYQAALADATQVIKLDPDDAKAYVSRSNVYNDLQDYQRALADLDYAIKLDPNNSYAYFSRSNVYQKLKNYQAALADATQVIKLAPNDANAYVSRSTVYNDLQDYQRALADLDYAIKLDPNNSYAYVFRSNVYKELKNYQAALADATQVIKLKPNNIRPYLLRGMIHNDLKDYEAAIADYTQVIKLQPDNTTAYFKRGVIYQKLENYNTALSDYKQALTKDDKLVDAMINIGYIKYEGGDVDGAIQEWEKAVTINTKLTEPQLAIAVALYAKGEKQKGLDMAQSALRLDKSWDDIEVLKQNLWGKILVTEAQKLLSHPSIQALRVKQP